MTTTKCIPENNRLSYFNPLLGATIPEIQEYSRTFLVYVMLHDFNLTGVSEGFFVFLLFMLRMLLFGYFFNEADIWYVLGAELEQKYSPCFEVLLSHFDLG